MGGQTANAFMTTTGRIRRDHSKSFLSQSCTLSWGGRRFSRNSTCQLCVFCLGLNQHFFLQRAWQLPALLTTSDYNTKLRWCVQRYFTNNPERLLRGMLFIVSKSFCYFWNQNLYIQYMRRSQDSCTTHIMEVSRIHFMGNKDLLFNKYLTLANIFYWLVLKEAIKVVIGQTIKYFTM